PDEFNQAALELLVCFPKLRVVNINHAAPKFRFSQVFLPIAEVLLVKRRILWRHPRLGMNSVRDTGNRHFMDWNTGPNIFPKRSGNFTVQFAHAVSMPA